MGVGGTKSHQRSSCEEFLYYQVKRRREVAGTSVTLV